MSASATPFRPRGSGTWLALGVFVAILIAACLILVLRTAIATFLVQRYLAAQNLRSEVTVDSIGLRGATAHGGLRTPGLALSFRRLTVGFDSRSFLPHIAQITIEQPNITLDLRRDTAFKTKKGSGSFGNIAIDASQAKVLVLTDAGPVEIEGNMRLASGNVQRINAVLLPTRLRSGIARIDVKGGSLHYDQSRRLQFKLAGDVAVQRLLRLANLRIDLDIPHLAWNGDMSATAGTARLSFAAMTPDGAPWSVDAEFSGLSVDFAKLRSSGEVRGSFAAALPPDTTHAFIARLPLLASDRTLVSAYEEAFRTLKANAHLSWTTTSGSLDLRLLEPADLRGGDAVFFRLLPSTVHAEGVSLSGQTAIMLRAPGVPELNVKLESLNASGDALDASLSLNGRVSIAGLRDLSLDAQLTAHRHGGVLEVALQRCAGIRVGAYMQRRTRVLADTAASLCSSNREPLFSTSPTGWTLQGATKDIRTELPSAGLKVSRASAELFIAGSGVVPESGLIHLSAAVSDAKKTPRMEPQTVTGIVEIARSLAHGRFNLAVRNTKIGSVTATYGLATGAGHADLDFSDLIFTRAGLQPAHISALFAPLAQADGRAQFTGRVDWSAKGITSSGRLDVEDLRFSSPLGAAQRLSTHMHFTSLVPLQSAPNQRVSIERIDWVAPLTHSDTLVSLSPNELKIVNTKTDVAGGEVSMTPLAVLFKAGSTLHGTVQLSHIAFGQLIAASNMGEKLKLEGPISGSLPFSLGPDGLRITDGRIEADGPGRLSISHTLWGKGETNAVQKAAYQALENLSYQSLTASINSVAGGRLHAVFHVVGYDDSPSGTQRTQFSLTDLLTGKAFQKEIPIPRGTAVNLTLDTSLNFDELLRGYETTWSQVTAQSGAPP